MTERSFKCAKEIPKDLIRNILNRKVVPFVGAGFSIAFGYPNWKELILGIKEELGITDLKNEDIEGVDPLQIAQSLFHYYSETTYINCMEEVLSDLDISSAQMDNSESLTKMVEEQTKVKLEIDFSDILLKLIVPNKEKKEESSVNKLKKLDKMHFSSVVTTNYDKVLEEEIFKTQHFKVQSLGKNEELDWNEKEKTIIKIHGDKESSSGLIFTHSQYYKFMNEYGYYRSKLYTIFSSNVILMMGYGFSDINIHQIYFQFLRDYGSNINGNKFYMVLTEYDLKKFKSYYNYYKFYLKSYKIEVLLVKDLPTFIEDLDSACKMEIHSASLENLLESSVTPEFSEFLIKIIEGDDPKVKYDSNLNNDILNAFIKIFDNDYLLTMDPFNLEEYDLSKVGLHMLKFACEIFEINEELIVTNEFKNILRTSIIFTNETRDFYRIRDRLEHFINLNKYIQSSDVNQETGEQLYEIFGFCHPTKYLRSNPGGKLIAERIKDLSIYVIEEYLKYILNTYYNEQEEVIYIDVIHKYWIELIKTKFEDESIQELVKKISNKHDE